MSEFSQAIWSQICEIIKTGINEQGYETWITPVRFLSASETEIALGVPSTFFQNTCPPCRLAFAARRPTRIARVIVAIPQDKGGKHI